MSFASNARNEVLNQKIENDCCSIAFLSAIVKCAGQINTTEDKKFVVEIFTELETLYQRVNQIVEQYYGKSCELEQVEDAYVAKNLRYRITLPWEITDQILIDLGIMTITVDGLKAVNNGISNFILADDCCKRAYVMGAFVSCATSNIVIKNYSNNEKNNSGYHLEFVFNFENLADDFVKLLEFFDIKSKITMRKNSPIVYIKEYQLICDTLALVGASKAVLALQNEAAIRDLRNNINRQTNCLNANLTKTVNASIKHLNAIKIIQDNVGLESLDEELMELCLIRLANPEENLENLRKLYKYNITKSGLNHRFSKIIAIAKKITKDNMKINNL